MVRKAIYDLIDKEDLLARTVGDSEAACQFPLKEAANMARASYGRMILGFRQTLASG